MNQKGQTLIETLVALSVALVLLTLATVATVTALSNVQRSKSQNQASKYAQQGLEIMRQLRDADWGTFSSLSGAYCMAEMCSTLTNGPGICGRSTGSCNKNVGIFSRTVTVDPSGCSLPGGNNQLSASQVTVSVAWSDNACPDANTLCRQTSVQSCLGNIYSDPGL